MKATAMKSRWRATSSRVNPITSRIQGPAHSVWMPICTPELRPRSGAMRQNSGVFMMAIIWPNCWLSGAGVVSVSLRGAAARMNPAASRISPAM